MEINQTPAGPQVINGYGDGGFRIGGIRYEGSVLVFPTVTLPWPVTAFDDIQPDTLSPVGEQDPAVEILLLGCGPSIEFVPHTLRAVMKEKGVVIEAMDTGAAARTFNVLFAEERRVAAALIAI